MKKKLIPLSFVLVLPTIVAFGAYHTTIITPLILYACIILITILVATNKISGKYIYFYLFGLSLGLIWQTTMLGVGVVGSDIHTEYYFAQYNLTHKWDITYPDSSNTSVVIGILAPVLSNLLMLEMIWIFKAVLPIFLAFVPLIMFMAFGKLFGEKRAYFATLFFMIIPMFSMEIAQIAKSMVAEIFFALMLLATVSGWKWYYKLIAIASSLVMQVFCHYTVGILGVCFMSCVFLFRFCSLSFKNWWIFRFKRVPVIVLLVSVILGGSTFYFYHGYAANASGMRSITDVASSIKSPEIVTIVHNNITGNNVGSTDVVSDMPKDTLSSALIEQMKDNPPLVKIGTGFDWQDVPVQGKVFRIIQYLTQVMILVGIAWSIYKYKKYRLPNEYYGFVFASGGLLLLCILMPNISQIINMTRFYHFSLFFIAPMFVLGCEAIASIRFRRQSGNRN